MYLLLESTLKSFSNDTHKEMSHEIYHEFPDTKFDTFLHFFTLTYVYF